MSSGNVSCWSLKFSYDKEIRRKELHQSSPITYRNVTDNIYTLFPNLKGKTLIVSWIDEEGDKVTCSSDREVQDAVKVMKERGAKTFHFTVKTSRVFRIPLFTSFKPDRCFSRSIHHGIACNGCGINPITGVRFQCTTRLDYNLCERCEEKSSKAYPMVKIYDPSQAPHLMTGSFSDRTSNESSMIMSFAENSSETMRDKDSFSLSLGDSDKKIGIDIPPSIMMIMPPTMKGKESPRFSADSNVLIPSGAVFQKVWKLTNNTSLPWPEGLHLDPIGDTVIVPINDSLELPLLPSLLPGCETEFTLEFIAPKIAGQYLCQYHVRTSTGAVVGETLSMAINVAEGTIAENDWDVVENQQKSNCESPESVMVPSYKDMKEVEERTTTEVEIVK